MLPPLLMHLQQAISLSIGSGACSDHDVVERAYRIEQGKFIIREFVGLGHNRFSVPASSQNQCTRRCEPLGNWRLACISTGKVGSACRLPQASAVEAAGMRALNEGDRVSFELEDDRKGKGKQAAQLKKA
jgi:hypothetical protein